MSRAAALWLRQLWALIWKEVQQGLRDPSSFLVAVVLPLLFLFIFGYGVRLDSTVLRVAVVNESQGEHSSTLVLAFAQSPSFRLVPAGERAHAEALLRDARIRGMVLLRGDFDACIDSGREAAVQLIVDGSEPNTAQFLQGYASGVVHNWWSTRQGRAAPAPLRLEERHWYNPAAISQNFLIPGSITVIMTLIGTLLTSLVFAREWERGTMEALFVTPVSRMQLLLGKLIPYFGIGMFSMGLCVALAVWFFGVPFRGSVGALVLLSSVFMCAALGQGLLISVLIRVQLTAAQAGLFAGLLPALMLGGFMFDIDSMPEALQWLTYLLPARYMTVCLRTIFLTGDVWEIFWPSLAFMASLALLLLGLVYRNLVKRLDA